MLTFISCCLHTIHVYVDDIVKYDYLWLMVGWFMVFNTTFNNISVILWQSVLLMEVPWENHRPVASDRQTLSYNVVSSTPRHEQGSNSQL